MTLLFPYSIIEEFLAKHPVVTNAKLNPIKIHECIAEMINTKPYISRINKMNANYICKSCNHRLLQDQLNGILLCSNCGLTKNYIIPENSSYFQKMEPLQENESRKASGFADGEWKNIDLIYTIEHFIENPKLNLYISTDEKEKALYYSKIPKGIHEHVRVCAAILFIQLSKHNDFEQINKEILSGNFNVILNTPNISMICSSKDKKKWKPKETKSKIRVIYD